MRRPTVALLLGPLLAGCGGPGEDPLHAQVRFAGRVRMESDGHVVAGRLAFDREAGVLQLAWDGPDGPVSLRRGLDGNVQAFRDGIWRSGSEAATTAVRTAELVVAGGEWWGAGSDYRVRCSGLEFHVQVQQERTPHGR